MHVLHIDSCCTAQPSCQYGHHNSKWCYFWSGGARALAVTCCRAYAVSMLHVALACESNRAGLATHWHCYLYIIAISKSLQGCCWWDAVLRIIRLLQERHACVHAWSCCLVSKSAGLPLSPVSIESKVSCTGMPGLPRTDSIKSLILNCAVVYKAVCCHCCFAGRRAMLPTQPLHGAIHNYWCFLDSLLCTSVL